MSWYIEKFCNLTTFPTGKAWRCNQAYCRIQKVSEDKTFSSPLVIGSWRTQVLWVTQDSRVFAYSCTPIDGYITFLSCNLVSLCFPYLVHHRKLNQKVVCGGDNPPCVDGRSPNDGVVCRIEVDNQEASLVSYCGQEPTVTIKVIVLMGNTLVLPKSTRGVSKRRSHSLLILIC